MSWPGRRGKGHRFILMHLCILCFLIFAIMAAQYQALAQPDEVHVFITGSDTLPTNTTTQYTIRITGGPAENNGTWGFEAKLEGPEGILKGADLEPINGTSSENTFKVNLTTPDYTQVIYLIVNGSSFNTTDRVWSGEVTKEITVFEPIRVNISAKIRNTRLIDVKGAVVTFYVDGALIGNKTVDVPANSTEEVYIEWMVSKTEEGEHEVEVRINEDGNLLEFDDGDNVMRKTIYVGERPPREMSPIMIFNSGIVFIIDTVAFLFFIGAFMMRRKTLRGRGYYGASATNIMYFMGILMIILSLPIFVVSQILTENPDVSGDPVGRLIEGIWIFVLGFGTILLTWDRTKKKRR